MQHFIDFISNKETYNRIFGKCNPTVEARKDWYEKFFGDYGAFAIKEEDEVFTIAIGVDGFERETKIRAEDLAERVYLYDRLELEGWAMVSINADKLLEDMKPGKDIDGHYTIINSENKEIAAGAIEQFIKDNPDYPELADSAKVDDLIVLETFA